MRKLTHTLLASALALGSSLALAQGEPQKPVMDPALNAGIKPTFEQLDVNRDGAVARTEVPADHELGTLFANFDRDGDQRLTRSEFDAYADEGEDEEEAE